MADEARMVFEFIDRSGGGGSPASAPAGTPAPARRDDRYDDASSTAQDNNERGQPRREPRPIPPLQVASPSGKDREPAALAPPAQKPLGQSLADTVTAASNVANTVRGGLSLNPLAAAQQLRGAADAGSRLGDSLRDVFGRARGADVSPVPSLDVKSAAMEVASTVAKSEKLVEKAGSTMAAVAEELYDQPMPQLPTFSAADLAKVPKAPPVIPGLAASLGVRSAAMPAAASAVGPGLLSAGTLGSGLAVGAALAAAVPTALAAATISASARADAMTPTLAMLSPEVAQAEARRKMTEFRANMESARRIGPETARGIDASAFLNAELQKLRDTAMQPFQELSNDMKVIAGYIAEQANKQMEGKDKSLLRRLFDLNTVYEPRKIITRMIEGERPAAPLSFFEWFDKQPDLWPKSWPGGVPAGALTFDMGGGRNDVPSMRPAPGIIWK